MKPFTSIPIQDKDGKHYLITMPTAPAPSGGKPQSFNDADSSKIFFQKITLSTDEWRSVLRDITQDNKAQRLSVRDIEEYVCLLLKTKDIKVYHVSAAVTGQQNKKSAIKKDITRRAAAGGTAGSVVSQLYREPDEASQVQASRNDAASFQPTAADSSSSDSGDENTERRQNDDSSRNCDQQGEPISMVSGEELLQLDDFILPGPIALQWTRSYRTSHSRNTGIGHGWSHAGNEYLIISDKTIEFYAQDNHKTVFARPPLGAQSKHLHEDQTLTFKDHETIIIEQKGQPTRLFRHAGGRRFRISQWLYLDYAGHGNIKGEQGFVLDFNYDQFGNLERIDGNWGRGLVITRDEFARIVAINQTSPNGKVLQPALVHYDYDQKGDLISARNADGYGEQYLYENHIIMQRTLASGYSFYFEWDQINNNARCLRQWGDEGYYAYSFKWDAEKRRSEATNSRGYAHRYDYNEFGLTTHYSDAEGHVHAKVFNDAGKLVAESNPLGHVTEYLYDDEQRLIRRTDAQGNRLRRHYTKGKLSQLINELGYQWRREYNELGLVTRVIGPNGETTQYTYNPQGLVTSITDAAGRTTSYEWNQQADIIRQTDPLGNHTYYNYDDWGRVSEVIRQARDQDFETAEQLVTRYEYTASGEVARVHNQDGTAEYEYNANNQLCRYTDPQGRVTQYKYEDGLNQPTQRIDAAGNILLYEYDSERNLVALINEKNEKYEFFYDGNDRLIKEVGFDGRTQHYKYNAAGQLVKHLDAGMVQTDYERDELGRLLIKTSTLISSAAERTREQTKYRYDELGRLIETANEHQYLAFEYDAFNNVVKETQVDIQSKAKQVITHQYNILGQRIQTCLPDGQVINYQYDDSLEFNKVLFNGDMIAQVERDSLGREIRRQQGQLETHSEYDPQGRLIRQQALHQSAKERIIQRAYAYDAAGNVNYINDAGDETRYFYDALDRLKHTDGRQPEFFDFDPAGNIVSISNTEMPAAGLVKGNRLLVQGDNKYLYDARGNLLKQARGKAGKLYKAYTYNLQNQLVKVESHDASHSVSYKYDPLGRRIAKTDTFGTTRFLWTDNILAQEQRNNLKKTYVFEPGSFKPLALIQDDQIYHYHLDHLGTPRELSNAQGRIVWKPRYRTYGNLAVKEIDEIENNLRFQGQYCDEETGLHYNNFRYYNPDTGQFISQDPIGLLGGLNNYQYVPNPVGWIDPLGLACAGSKKESPTLLGAFRKVIAPIRKPLEIAITVMGLTMGYADVVGMAMGQIDEPDKIDPFGTRDHSKNDLEKLNDLDDLPPPKPKPVPGSKGPPQFGRKKGKNRRFPVPA